MTPDTFMGTFILVRNSLEKQNTRFREAFPPEKRVAIAFRFSHQKYSMKNVLRPAALLKKRLWERCFPVNFAKFLRTPFLQNTSGRLLLKIFCVSRKILYFYHIDLTTNPTCGNYNGFSKNLLGILRFQ